MSCLRISPFLSDIARGYNSKTEYVAFCKLDKDLGQARRSFEKETYRILLDPTKIICPIQMLFAFYHEIAHIELFHLGYKHYPKSTDERIDKELQADHWAFKEMGTFDSSGIVKKEDETCYNCIRLWSKTCAKKPSTNKSGNRKDP